VRIRGKDGVRIITGIFRELSEARKLLRWEKINGRLKRM